jgi:hypothetical protein
MEIVDAYDSEKIQKFKDNAASLLRDVSIQNIGGNKVKLTLCAPLYYYSVNKACKNDYIRFCIQRINQGEKVMIDKDDLHHFEFFLQKKLSLSYPGYSFIGKGSFIEVWFDMDFHHAYLREHSMFY